jgi:hypothetical protein
MADIRIAKDIATEATWADVLRENSAKGRELTEQWHFVDIDFDHPDFDKACFGHPAVGAGEVASHAPAQSCVSDKIDQFVSALKNAETPASERLLALKFLLHFVGDIHQPLHAATHIDHERGDRGGNCVGILHGHATEPIKLHAYWDTDLVVGALGSHQEQAVSSVMSLVTAQSKQEWASGKSSQWAQESFKLAKSSAYAGVINKTPVQTDFIFEDHGHPDAKCGPSNVYRIDPSYDEQADKVVAEQLTKAGVRLAWLLTENLR